MKLLTILKISLFSFFVASSCTPKASAPIVEEKEEETNREENEGQVEDAGCVTWNGKSFMDYALEQHVIYRDFIRRGNLAEAYPEWRIAFELAPAADGQRATHFEDGIQLFDYFLQQEADTLEKKPWLDSILHMYNRMGNCYFDNAYIAGRKAFDLYYKYRYLVDDRDIMNYFMQAIDSTSSESKVFIMNPFTALLVEKALDESISTETAREYAQKIMDQLSLGLLNCGNECEEWKIVESYVPAQIERLESIRGMFDCSYYRNKYFPQYLADSTNCEVIEQVYIRMNWGGCDKEGPEMQRVANAARELCKSSTRNETLAAANEALENGRYREAIQLIDKYIDEETDDADRKASMKLRIANIYYAYLKNFPAARQAAQQAARFRPSWGEPFMLIGILYASSGPLCGPGRGWDSQIVVWPAIDMWNRAKSLDGSVSGKANQLIGRYSQYMPSVGDIFQRGLQEGQSYFVPCWIQETTTIRAAR